MLNNLILEPMPTINDEAASESTEKASETPETKSSERTATKKKAVTKKKVVAKKTVTKKVSRKAPAKKAVAKKSKKPVINGTLGTLIDAIRSQVIREKDSLSSLKTKLEPVLPGSFVVKEVKHVDRDVVLLQALQEILTGVTTNANLTEALEKNVKL